ncbi:Hypothetical predicted protein [Marmota monax]|uniref:Uncharacterized protein n=1 Tax=Marmota monax TaxID=9995 RepID=A0A5E4AVQ5_MARMO|nr:Hypothetical predicted protein [Marmota monax]
MDNKDKQTFLNRRNKWARCSSRESLRFPASTVLGRNPALDPHPSRGSEPAALRHLFTALSDRPRPLPPLQRRASPQPPAMATTSPSQVRQNYHQDSEASINCQINLEL